MYNNEEYYKNINKYDYSDEIKEIEKNCEENNQISSQNNLVDSIKINKIEYISYLEFIKENILENKYEIKPEFKIKFISLNNNEANKIRTIANFIVVSPLELYYKMKFESFHKISHDEDRCSICLDSLYDISKKQDLSSIVELNNSFINNYNVLVLEKCNDHFFHLECVANMIGTNKFIKCPVCSKIYGEFTGTQPYGTMTAYIDSKLKCDGFKNFNTIIINYYFPHGKTYSGTRRTAYLPDTIDGRKVLGLLKVCFDRKLIFSVGTSVTTGAANTTVWAGIHHKTNITGGTSRFGYPDETYFNRVQEEMACRGVSIDSLDKKPETIAEIFLNFSSTFNFNN